MSALRAVVAVPVRDEADRIAACLQALTLGQSQPPLAVVLAVNNTTDATVDVVRALEPALGTPVVLLIQDFPPEQACAGQARRLALEHAAERYAPDVLLTTDADSLVPPDWVAANLRHLEAGAAAVAGRAVLSDADAALIPARLHEDDRLEVAYAAALDAITDAVDPEPWDRLPRHSEHSGASIAVRLEAYRRAGGMPAAHLGEDRAFFAALRRVDARIRHACEIAVTVSGRTVGRAEGGMADTIRRRLRAPDPFLDSALSPAADHLRRVQLRRGFRVAWSTGIGDLDALARQLELPAAAVRTAMQAPYFGEGWDALDAASPALPRRLVPSASVRQELDRAHDLLAGLPRWPALAATPQIAPEPSA